MENKKYTGRVISFNPKKGWGFIEWSKDGVKQKDIFVHFSDIQSNGFKSLNKDEHVVFELGANFHGALKAINVCVIH